MKLKHLTSMLLKLESEGHGEKEVLYRHTASDDCGEVWGAGVTNRVSDCGPFHLSDGEFYVSINVGGN